MRYIDLNVVIASIPTTIRKKLRAVDASMLSKTDAQKIATARKGKYYWSQVKPYLEAISHRKCWYTESKNPGCVNDVEHFRPKAKVLDDSGNIGHWYWFLAFNLNNYRLSSQISNRLNSNSALGATGGKGDQFPLMPGNSHELDIVELVHERPVILDPCNEADTELLEFQPDGRPVVSMKHATDADVCFRVEKSKLLLNLDYPTFNEDREHLYNKIRKLVDRGDRYVRRGDVDALEDAKDDLCDLMREDAEYSKAAECYIRCFRDRVWVEEFIL